MEAKTGVSILIFSFVKISAGKKYLLLRNAYLNLKITNNKSMLTQLLKKNITAFPSL